MKNNYAVFILTHKRADHVVTAKTLKRHGYSGRVIYVLDSTDTEIEKYKENFGEENVVVFDKRETKKEFSFDIMDSLNDDRCVVFARNEVFRIAKNLGFEYLVVLDDDYTHFNFRFDKDFKYKSIPITDMDSILGSMINYVATTPVDAVSFSQGGDFIGGKSGSMAQAVKTKRKGMNLFVFETNKPVTFTGRINEDVNMYLREGSLGRIILTTTQVCLEQLTTQTNKGGLTDIYLDKGTDVKSFYSVMVNPSSVKINLMGNKHRRLHHVIGWNKTVPKIIRQEYKKINA